jgi:hypothetical protein
MKEGNVTIAMEDSYKKKLLVEYNARKILNVTNQTL